LATIDLQYQDPVFFSVEYSSVYIYYIDQSNEQQLINNIINSIYRLIILCFAAIWCFSYYNGVP